MLSAKEILKSADNLVHLHPLIENSPKNTRRELIEIVSDTKENTELRARALFILWSYEEKLEFFKDQIGMEILIKVFDNDFQEDQCHKIRKEVMSGRCPEKINLLVQFGFAFKANNSPIIEPYISRIRNALCYTSFGQSLGFD